MRREAGPTTFDPGRPTVPHIALLLSLLALWIPVVASAFGPDWMSREIEMLSWLLAVLPAFLLSYYRGWKGASVALAGFMAALAASQVVFNLRDTTGPPVEILLVLVSVAIVVSLGSGFLSEAFRRSLTEAQHGALTDVMTGLPNRRLALLQLERAFAAASRGHPLAVALFDLDHFKSVNDSLGHAAGDELIGIFAEVLRNNTRAMDVAARFGGEEFIVILEGVSPREVQLYADRVRIEYADRDFKGLSPTVSAGIAFFEEGMASPDVLIAAADHALFRAKENGRNRIAQTGEGRHLSDGKADDAKVTLQGRNSAEESLVLIVDDEASARRTVSRALRSLGYSVLEATDGESAVKVLEGLDDPVDVLLTDIMMPGISGFRLVEMVQRFAPHIAVVYMSGYAQKLPLWEGAPGMQGEALQKPFSVKELETAVKKALQRQNGADAESADTTGTRGGESRRTEILVLARHTPTILEHILGIRERVGAHVRTEELSQDPLQSRSLWRMCSVLVVHGAGLSAPWFRPLQKDVESGVGPRALILVECPVEPSEWITGLGGLALPGSSDPAILAEQVYGVHRATRGLLGRERHIHSLESKVEARSAQLSEALSGALLRLARAGEYRDDLTGKHAERVGMLSGMLATRLGLAAELIDRIEKTAPLHDIGKIAIPDSILNKPGALTPSEREVIESHTEVGARMLHGREPLFRTAALIARHHHEGWDGTGYPDRLSGSGIPIEARIVAVADVWDSLSNERPYRKALSPEETLRMVKELAGQALDPSIVPLLEAIVTSGEIVKLDDLAPTHDPSEDSWTETPADPTVSW